MNDCSECGADARQNHDQACASAQHERAQTTNKSAPADHLAALDFHATAQARANGYARLRSFDELREASDAFAELIAAVQAEREAARYAREGIKAGQAHAEAVDRVTRALAPFPVKP